MGYEFKYWRPQATVDIVVVRKGADPDNGNRILLIQRGNEPYKGYWALPGGFIDSKDDTLSSAAKRELMEETGLSEVPVTQVGAWGSKGRDPRDWTVTVVFGVLLEADDPRISGIKAADDAAGSGWFEVGNLPDLAFDHAKVIPCALDTLLHKIHAIGNAVP